jgi:hypothetical protein
MSEIFNKVEVLIDEILIEVIALKIVQRDFIPYKQAYSQALNQVAMRYAEIFPVRKTILETLLALKFLKEFILTLVEVGILIIWIGLMIWEVKKNRGL